MGFLDTSPDIRAKQAEIHRRMGGVRRMELAMDMSLAVREFTLTRLRREYPEKSAPEIMKAFIDEVLLPAADFSPPR